MLAVRKLLLADDSSTIQKIVALTFADAGIDVVAVSGGDEAIQYLREDLPDVVLADAFMPGVTGYQVCEHVKQTERLKHIPVMLLVGSFEPFDEAEARRVGADDILTKPFQSIRTLMDRVGTLLGRSSTNEAPSFDTSDPSTPSMAETVEIEPEIVQTADPTSGQLVRKEAETKELLPPEVIQPPAEPLSTETLAITTADTQPLSPEIRQRLEHPASLKAEDNAVQTTLEMNVPDRRAGEMEDTAGEALLDLDRFEPISFSETDDVILDIDFDGPVDTYTPSVIRAAQPESTKAPAYAHAFAGGAVNDHFQPDGAVVDAENDADVAPEAAAHFVDSDVAAGVVQPVEAAQAPQSQAAVAGNRGPVTLDQLSPEAIDAIVRRVIQQMSEKAVQEIAWEVVPQLADLMIKKRLDEDEKLTAK